MNKELTEEEIYAIADVFKSFGDCCSQIQEKVDHALNVFGKRFEKSESAATETEKPTEQEFNDNYWEDKQSDKGPYSQTSKRENNNSTSFQKLQKYIKNHNGFAVLHGFKFWTFSSNQEVLGRRKV